jgi:hypothetical protein
MPTRSNQDIGPSNDGSIRVQREQTISMPSPDSERGMFIRFVDWKKLETRLTAAIETPKDYSTLYGILFGLSGSAFLSLMPLGITKDLPAWVLPAYSIFAVASLFCGIFTIILSRDQRRTRKTIITVLLDDVKEIGSRYTTTPTQNEQVTDPKVVEPLTPPCK